MALIIDILAGLFLGMCYDLFKAFRHEIKKTIGDILFDFIFWIFALAVCIRLFLLTGDRKFRNRRRLLLLFFGVLGIFCQPKSKNSEFFPLFFKNPLYNLKILCYND